MINIVRDRGIASERPPETDPHFWIVGDTGRETNHFNRWLTAVTLEASVGRNIGPVADLLQSLTRGYVSTPTLPLFSEIFEGDNTSRYTQKRMEHVLEMGSGACLGSRDAWDEVNLLSTFDPGDVSFYTSAGLTGSMRGGEVWPIFYEVDDSVEWTPRQRQKAHEVGATVAVYQTAIEWPDDPDAPPTIKSNDRSINFGLLPDESSPASFELLSTLPLYTRPGFTIIE